MRFVILSVRTFPPKCSNMMLHLNDTVQLINMEREWQVRINRELSPPIWISSDSRHLQGGLLGSEGTTWHSQLVWEDFLRSQDHRGNVKIELRCEWDERLCWMVWYLCIEQYSGADNIIPTADASWREVIYWTSRTKCPLGPRRCEGRAGGATPPRRALPSQ